VKRLALLVLVVACRGRDPSPSRPPAPVAPKPTPTETPVAVAAKFDPKPAIDKLVAKHGDAQRERIERGVAQAASLWRAEDGDTAAFTAFCAEQFVTDPNPLFERMQVMIEQIKGHNLEIGRAARWHSEVDTGPLQPIDGLLAAYDPSANVVDDLFKSKVAFAVLLNFPLATLETKLKDGPSWDRRRWAEARLTGWFDTRVPSALAQAAIAAEVSADQYIAGYNIWMHHVLTDGKRLFPSGKRLISHWNLRDELKANYADADGVAKQRTIAKIMDRIVTQTIPRAVIDNPNLDWDPFANKVTPAQEIEPDAPKKPAEPSDAPEPDTRFAHVRDHFLAGREIDKFSPLAPTRVARAFEGAEMPEPRVRALLVELLESPLAADAAKEMEKRLGRKPEPQDIWYEFGVPVVETELDKITRKKYPTADAFAKDIPRILRDLGFTAQRAQYLADHILVDPSRGAGHAMGAERRGDKAHLRTRVESGGMDYKGYNIAVHELGHNIEQTFSLYDIDYPLLAGVPNTALTEALAFLFQARDRKLLGVPEQSAEVERLRVLDHYWNTREIAGSALVELDVWQWLYAHPTATAAELKDATVRIAKETWNKYYEPTLGGHDTALLGIYSHTITSPMYLFNYVLGHLIAFQVEEHLAGKDAATFAKEFERVTRLGQILPDLWMQQATGKPVTAEPMLKATEAALRSSH
jgi:hypothetical protein